MEWFSRQNGRPLSKHEQKADSNLQGVGLPPAGRSFLPQSRTRAPRQSNANWLTRPLKNINTSAHFWRPSAWRSVPCVEWVPSAQTRPNEPMQNSWPLIHSSKPPLSVLLSLFTFTFSPTLLLPLSLTSAFLSLSPLTSSQRADPLPPRSLHTAANCYWPVRLAGPLSSFTAQQQFQSHHIASQYREPTRCNCKYYY